MDGLHTHGYRMLCKFIIIIVVRVVVVIITVVIRSVTAI